MQHCKLYFWVFFVTDSVGPRIHFVQISCICLILIFNIFVGYLIFSINWILYAYINNIDRHSARHSISRSAGHFVGPLSVRLASRSICSTFVCPLLVCHSVHVWHCMYSLVTPVISDMQPFYVFYWLHYCLIYDPIFCIYSLFTSISCKIYFLS